MKKALIILLHLLFAHSVYAQISVSQAAKKEESLAVMPYDSTKNWLGHKNLKSYIGQTLYVNGLPKELRKSGYSNFKTIKEPKYQFDARYGEPAGEFRFNTKYESLAYKYFVVLDVVPDSSQEESALFAEFNDWWFKLQNKDNAEDIVWFKYNGAISDNFPFVTVSYYNHLKKTMIGKRFVMRYTVEDDVIKSCINDVDFNTGKSIVQTKADRWSCIDITIENENCELVAMIKNQKGEVTYFPVDCYFHDKGNEPSDNELFEESRYNRLVQKYGVENMELVRKRKIKVGMPKYLLSISWGKPDKINKSSNGTEQ